MLSVHKRSASTSSTVSSTQTRRLPPALRSVRRALTVSRFESPQHRRKRRKPQKQTAPPQSPASQLNSSALSSSSAPLVIQLPTPVPTSGPTLFSGRKLVPIMLARSMEVPLVIRVNLDKNTHFKPSIPSGNILVELPFRCEYSRLRCISMWLDAKVFHGTEPRRPNCGLPWNSPWFSNLTELTWYPSVTHSLTLMNTKTYGDTLDRTLSFPLRNLRTLHLSEPLPICSQILTSLRFPSIVTATVSCLTLRNGREPSGYLIDTILYKSLCVNIHHDGCKSPLAPALASMARYSTAAWFTCITTLHVNVPLERDSWLNLCKCSNVVHLAISTVNPISILALLMERAMCRIGRSDREADGSCKQFFPRLDELILKNITFKKPPPFPQRHDTL
ncbi:F-box domain-containing protein, partial [Favolaschia claudopus]